MCRYLPRFGANGKGGVTVAHLLTHTAGVPYADLPFWKKLHEWDGIIHCICDAPLVEGWVSGERCGCV